MRALVVLIPALFLGACGLTETATTAATVAAAKAKEAKEAKEAQAKIEQQVKDMNRQVQQDMQNAEDAATK